MVAISTPYLLIVKSNDGRTEIFFENDSSTETTFQLRNVLFKRYRTVDILDSKGQFFADVRVEPTGLDFASYRLFGVSGWIAMLIGLMLLSVLVRCKLATATGGVLEFKEMKKALLELCSFEGFRSAIPKDELRRLINNSTNAMDLVTKIGSNQ